MAEKIKVLYVDDEDVNLFFFNEIFNDYFDVSTATSGFEGLKKLDKNNGIKVVVSDMVMPEMNGIEFITAAQKRYKDKVFILTTGYAINKEIIQALDKGVIARYLSKPFETEKMLDAVNKAMG